MQYLLPIPRAFLRSMLVECAEAGGHRLVLLALVTRHGGHWGVRRVSDMMMTLSPHTVS